MLVVSAAQHVIQSAAESEIGPTYDHRITGLEDLIVGTDAHSTKIVTAVDCSSRFDGAGDNVVDHTQGDRPVEDIAKQFDDLPIRAMVDQDHAQDQLP
jgi:hypothetical protein